MVSIEINGTRRVRNGLRRIVSDFHSELDSTIGEWSQEEVEELKIYPPPPENSSYERTGRLRRGWRARKGRSRASWHIENPVEYVHWVQGDSRGERQAWMHVGRWQIARKKVEEDMPKLRKRLEGAINGLVNKHL